MMFDELQSIAQPLHGCASDEDRTFERIGSFSIELIGNGCKQTIA